MASLVFGVAGAVIGNFIAPGVGGSYGFAIGSALGGALFPGSLPDQIGPRLNDLKVQSSTYGSMIPIYYGTMRGAGNIIWSADLREHRHDEDQGGKGGPSQTTTTFTYTASLAVSMCAGPIVGVRRIWADSTLIYDATSTNSGPVQMDGLQMAVYVGDETQLADPTIEGYLGAGNVPGYRGRAYVVFTDFPLEKFGNRIPNFSFEVVASGSVSDIPTQYNYPVGTEGTTLVYNPLLNEIWATMEGPVQVGFEAIDPSTGAVVGTISCASASAQIQNGPYGNPLYDPFSKYIYVLGYAPVKLLKFDAKTRVFLDGLPWPGIQFFTVSPIDGNLWASAIISGVARLQERSPLDGSSMQNLVIPGGFAGPLLVDKIGNIWINSGNKLARYNWATTKTFDIYSEPDNINYFTYDKDRNSIWYSTFPSGGDGPTIFITDITQANPGKVEAPAHGFVNGQQVYIYSVSGMIEVNGRPFYVTVVDVDHFTIGIDTTGYSAYTASGGVSGLNNEIKEFNIDSLSVTKTIKVPTSRLGEAGDVFYDHTKRVIWALNDNFGYITGINTMDGSIYKTIHVPNQFLWWAAFVDGTPWLNDSGEHTITRVLLDRVTPSSIALSAVVSDLSVKAGLTTGDINVTALTDSVDGYAITRQAPVRSAVEQLQQAYFFDAVESDTVAKFVKRGGASAVTIPSDDLAAHAYGDQLPDIISSTRVQEVELPSALNILYLNPAADYQTSTQQSKRLVGASGEAISSELPIVLSDDHAKQIADVSMFNAWTARTSYKFATTNKYAKYEPTDVMTVNGKVLRVVKKDEGRGIIKWEAVAELAAIYAQAGTGAGSTSTAQTVPTTSFTNLELLDIPMLRDQDNDAGFYYAGAGYVAGWPGAVMYKSTDSGATYVESGAITAAATVGVATTLLANFTGGNVFDTSNTVAVSIIGGATLSGATELAVLNGANAVLLGNEIIQYKTATLNGDGTYTLSGLLRGRKGSEWAMTTHVAGDRFVALSAATLRRLAATSAEIGLARTYKGVTIGMTLASTGAQTFMNAAVALKPYAPVQLAGTRDGSNNLTINWIRRTRVGGEWRDYVDAPLGESSESYDVEIWNSTYTTLKRTFSALSSATTPYTAAQQTTDGTIPGNPVYVRVFQLSATIGRGYKLEGIV